MAEGIHIAILGCGFMGTALLHAWLNQTSTPPKHLTCTFAAHVRSASSLEKLQLDLSKPHGKQAQLVRLSHGNDQLVKAVEGADLVILGFLPTQLSSIMRTPGLVDVLHSKVVVSILAGVSQSQLETELRSSSSSTKDFNDRVRTACVIPTLGCKIEESVTLLASSDDFDSKPHMKLVEELFSRIGSVVNVPEPLLAATTALGAAVHALSIVAVDTITDASVADGIPRDIASNLATLCLRSAAGMLSHGGYTPESMKAAMSTPNGITLNTLVNLDANVRAGIASAARHAIGYTKTMNG